MTKKIEVSHKTIIFTILVLLFVAFLYHIRDIILVFFIGLLIMAILNPTVTKLSEKKIPRGLSVFVVYILAIAVITISVAGVAPPLVEQTTRLIGNFPNYLSAIGLSSAIGEQVTREIISQLGSLPAQLVKFGLSIFSNLIALLSVLIFAFYMLMARKSINKQIEEVLGVGKSKNIIDAIDRLETNLGGWARGQLLLMILVGLFVFIGLSILGIPYAVPLSFFAAIFEVIPNFGPFIGAIPAVAIAFGISPFLGFATIALYTLVQQIENYVFVPKIMEKSTGVSPVMTLLSLAIGFKLAGIAGALISIPVYITIQTLLKEYISRK